MPNIQYFIHIQAVITYKSLPPIPNANFPAQWAVVQSGDQFTGNAETPRNIVLCSMLYLIDPSLAPDRHYVIHVYVPVTETYDDWEGMKR